MNLSSLLVPTPRLFPLPLRPHECVHCREPVDPSLQKLHTYPDGCAAHLRCHLSDGGNPPYGTGHWHSVEARNEEALMVVEAGDWCPSGHFEGEQ
jgi:hypothetical protein